MNLHLSWLPALGLLCTLSSSTPVGPGHSSLAGLSAPPPDTVRPRNIILLIGDGMGMTQVTAGLYSHDNSLNLERFPVTGLVKTHSAKQLITDSAAGATAFACGCKTVNGAVGMTAEEQPCLSFLEEAEQRGMATGLVASCSITHATPAAFIAHAPNRASTQDIATFFLKTDLDLLIGGGMRNFNERTEDQRNLIEEMKTKGWQVNDFTQKQLSKLTLDPAHPFAWFTARDEPDPVTKGRDYLPQAAKAAPVFLKKRSDKGFFLMLEGSQIDWACHANEGSRAIREMLDFDAAVGEILRFAEHDGQTLVVVTADHETGGMAIEQGSAMDSLKVTFSTGYHTAAMVPVFAYGPGAREFSGILDNTDIYWKMRRLLRWPAPTVPTEKAKKE
ncbi:MAG TPA: alkaline phosphatase [Saprospiraceae bacterium]|nr:alkaline phosphatase [Saprospiraceae bacterium]HNG88791.1 alkaline phosphatase [Saprospiraceae bacterium]